MSTPAPSSLSPGAITRERTVPHFAFRVSRFTLQVAALTLLALVLRRYMLGDQSFWFDEADIVQRARQPLSSLLVGFTEAGENGPLYTLLLHYWLALIDAFPAVTRLMHAIFGVSYEAPVRGMAMLFGAAAIPALYALARQVGGHWLGITSATLLAFNPFHIWHSQDAKMYSLLVLMAIVSSLLYLRAWEHNTPGAWLSYVLATWVMLTVHSMAVLVWLAHLAVVPFFIRGQGYERKRGAVRSQSAVETEESKIQNRGALRATKIAWLWAMLLILLPLFPIAWLRVAALLTGTADIGGWYATTTLGDIAFTMFVSFAVNRADPFWELTGAILMAALALLGTLSLLSKRPSFDLTTQSSALITRYSVLALWLVPIIAFWLVTLAVPLFQPRYLIMALPPYLIMASAGLLALRRLHFGALAVGMAALGIATWAALLGVNYSPQVQKEDWRSAIQYVKDHARLRDTLIVFPGYLRTAVDLYYTPGGPGRVPDIPIEPVPSLSVENFGPRELEDALRRIIKCHERAWLVTSPPRQELEDPENRVQAWLQYNWRTFDTRVYNGVTVYGISFNEQPDCWYPAPDHREPYEFENGMMLLGYTYEIREYPKAQPDASYFPLTLYWTTPERLQTDYLVRIQIADQAGRVIVDEALGPLQGYWPTTQWPPEAYIIDYRDLWIPGGQPPGDYTVSLQVYPEGKPEEPLMLRDSGTQITLETPLPVEQWQP